MDVKVKLQLTHTVLATKAVRTVRTLYEKNLRGNDANKIQKNGQNNKTK